MDAQHAGDGDHHARDLESGAIFTSTSPDFGPAGCSTGSGRSLPKCLWQQTVMSHAGRRHDRREALQQIVAELPSVRQVYLVGELESGSPVDLRVPTHDFHDLLSGSGTTDGGFTQMPFDAPGFVLYSSGTTGVPKCLVHRGAGLLLKHASEHRWHLDVRPEIGCSGSPPAAG